MEWHLDIADQNSKPVVDRIRKISAKKGAVSVRTFDFSTLYTKILTKGGSF